MEAFVQQVRAQTDILAVVQGYVPLKRKGNRYWGCCPFHSEKTASFSVVPADGFFYCFGCHAGGDVFKFLSLIEQITPFEAIKRQAEQLGIPLPEQKRDPREEARLRELDDLRKVNALARDFFHNCLTMTRYGAAGKDYLAGRGITAEAIEGYGPPVRARGSVAFEGARAPQREGSSGRRHGLWLRARPVSSVGRISMVEGPLSTGVH